MIRLHACSYIPGRCDGFCLDVDSLEIEKGARVFVVGPSGSGKTSLLKALAGLLIGCSGALHVGGEKIEQGRLRKRGISMVYLSQELGLWPHLSCGEHIAFVASRGKSLADRSALHWLDRVGLKGKYESLPRQLSGGERKRLALARAMASEPDYLFLDEPFANIDMVLAGGLLAMIDREQARGRFTLVKVTHHRFGLWEENVTIIIMDEGKIVQKGTLEEIARNPATNWTRQWLRLLQ